MNRIPQVFAPAHENAYEVLSRRVFFAGTGAVTAGLGVGYTFPTNGGGGELITEISGRRAKIVNTVSQTNNAWFAGVVRDSKPANASGQMIEIAEPGSIVDLPIAAAVTKGQIIGCIANDSTAANIGKWGYSGYAQQGRGSALVLQSQSDTSLTAQCLLLDGDETGLIESVALAAGANTLMVGGTTRLAAATLASAATATLADGTYIGQRKLIVQAGTLTTNGLNLTITTGKFLDEDSSVLQVAPVALTKAAWAAAAATGLPHADFVWTASGWWPVSYYGVTLTIAT